MLEKRWTTESRLSLVAIASMGLMLCSTRTLFGFHGWPRTLSSLAGIAVAIYVANISLRGCSQTEPKDGLTGWADLKAAAIAVSAMLFLAAGHFVPAASRIHALENGVGWLLTLLCLTFPESRWREVAFTGAYAVVLLSLRWSVFAAFKGVPIQVLAAMLVGWIVVSGTLFLFLIRRKSSASPPALH